MINGCHGNHNEHHQHFNVLLNQVSYIQDLGWVGWGRVIQVIMSTS